jgi:hypothetical protein
MIMGNCQSCGTLIDARHKRCRDCYLKYVGENATGGKRNVKRYDCRNGCGRKTTNKSGLYLECYRTARLTNGWNAGKIVKYPCRNNCGRMTTIVGGLCRVCLDKARLELGEKQQAEKERKKQKNLEVINQRLNPHKKVICPKRDGLGHYWILDGESYGVCKCCGKGKNFRAIQKRLQIPQIISSESYS